MVLRNFLYLLAIEFGPVLLFFLSSIFFNFLFGAGVLVISTIAALVVAQLWYL
jgi:hypothetical protein